jgi:hypothetical protein
MENLAFETDSAPLYDMFKPAADAWALEVARQVVEREVFETTHVELKAEVPHPKKFVRQFAGLANAAAWHPVLLLLGLDRQAGVVGVEPFEIGDWYQSLRSLFEYGEAPALVYQNFLTFNDKQLAAFVFETDNPPYVVGESKQGGHREVPWRYGSNTGVAGRRELLSVLLRRMADPEVEFTKAELRMSEEGALRITAELFVFPAPDSNEIAIPVHRTEVHIVDTHGTVQVLPDEVKIRPVNDKSEAKLVDEVVVVGGVCKLQLSAQCEAPSAIAVDSSAIDLSFTIHPAQVSAPIRYTTTITRREHPDWRAYWELPQHHSRELHTNAAALEEIARVASRFPKRINWNPFGTLPRPDGW